MNGDSFCFFQQMEAAKPMVVFTTKTQEENMGDKMNFIARATSIRTLLPFFHHCSGISQALVCLS